MFLRAAAMRLACLPHFHALLTIPHGLQPVADRRPLVGHLGELWIFRGSHISTIFHLQKVLVMRFLQPYCPLRPPVCRRALPLHASPPHDAAAFPHPALADIAAATPIHNPVPASPATTARISAAISRLQVRRGGRTDGWRAGTGAAPRTGCGGL